jgi:hypothetical protein
MVILSVVVVVIYTFACLSLGAKVLSLILRRFDDWSEENIYAYFASALLLGQGLLGLVWTLIGTAGWFSVEIVGLVTGLAVLSGVRLAYELSRDIGHQTGQHLVSFWKQEPIGWIALAGLTVLLALLYALLALMPPQHVDALAFYMPLPKLISETGTLLAVPNFEEFSRIPLMAELHFAALFTLESMQAAKLFVWVVTLAGVLMFIGLMRELGLERRIQWLALAAIFSSTIITNLIWNGKVDLFGMGLALAVFYWTLQMNGVPQRDRILVALAGLFAGLAIVAKYTYIVFLPVCTIVLVAWRYMSHHDNGPLLRKEKLRGLFGVMVILGVTAFSPAIPHIIKNTVLFNEPLAPLIGTGFETSQGDWYETNVVTRIIVTYPVTITYGSYPGQGGRLSPIILALLPLVLLLLRHRIDFKNKWVQLGGTAIVGIVLWTVILPSVFAPRYYMPLLLVYMLVVLAGFVQLREFMPRPDFLQVGLVVMSLVVLLVNVDSLRSESIVALRYATGAAEECETDHLPSNTVCEMSEILNEDAAEGDRIYTVTFSIYWLRTDLMQCIIDSADIQTIGTGNEEVDEFWHHLAERNFRYMMIDRNVYSDIFNDIDPSLTPEGIEVETLFLNEFGALYRIEGEVRRNSQVECREVEDSIWEVKG